MFNSDNDTNRNKILSLLYKKRELTKQDIARDIGVSIPTVISNVNELLEEGLVEESGVADSTGGRKPVLVRFLPESRYSFGVDINPDRARVVLTNLDSEIKYDEVFLISDLKNINLIMERVYKLTEEAIQITAIDREKILGIGFSLPGTVNEEKFILELAPNLSIKNVDFKQFQNLFSFPIYIENEANSAAFGELILGIAKEMRNLVYISITSGVGTGIVIQDHIYKGKNKRAGEFGHMTVIPNGKLCKCGRKGCWEMYASQKSLIEDFNIISEITVSNLSEFFHLVSEGNKTAIDYFEKYLNALAVGIQNIVIILDPHYIVIGGEISEFADFYLEKLKEKVFVENSFYDRSELKIMVSKLRDKSSILGASLLPIQKMFSIEEKII